MKAQPPKWLIYALLCLFWWGIWGFLAKLGADQMAPIQMQVQVLFTLGLLPLVFLALLQLHWKLEVDQKRNGLWRLERSLYRFGSAGLLRGSGERQGFNRRAGDLIVPFANGRVGLSAP